MTGGLAEPDPDPALALWCARRLLDADSSDEASPLTKPAGLVTSRRALVRAVAVELLPDAELMALDGDAPRLERLLLDPSGGVRILPSPCATCETERIRRSLPVWAFGRSMYSDVRHEPTRSQPRRPGRLPSWTSRDRYTM